MVISKNPQLIEQPPDQENMQVIVYVKEGCIYCMMAKDLLAESKIIYEAIDLGSDLDLRKKLNNNLYYLSAQNHREWECDWILK